MHRAAVLAQGGQVVCQEGLDHTRRVKPAAKNRYDSRRVTSVLSYAQGVRRSCVRKALTTCGPSNLSGKTA
jgi:hypothetical protein